MNRSTPGHLLHYVTRRLRLRRYLKDPGDGRQQPQIPAQALLWALLIGQILRESSFLAVEALVRSSARRTLRIATPFCDDTLGYFTERLDPGPTRQALLSLLRGAKRNKAFDDCRWIGLALDGTGAGWRTHLGCQLCRPKQNAAQQIQGYQHSLVMISVVGTGLSLPCDGEPYGPGDSEYAAGQRLLRRVLGGVGKRFAQYVVVDGKFATAPFLHTAGELGLRVVARLKDNLPELFAAAQQRFPCGPPTTVFQHRPDRTVVEAYWLTNFPCSTVGPQALFGMAKSRWEIENQGFNEAKSRHGLEHICHHHANSLLIGWLLTMLALTIERLYRLRYLHRGKHRVHSSAQLLLLLWLSLSRPRAADSS